MDKDKTLIILKGLPASGKSTWAREQLAKHPGRYKVVSKDNLRAMLDGGTWSKANEAFIVKARDALLTTILGAGFSAISDDTNLWPAHVTRLSELGTNMGASVRLQDFTHVSLADCLARDSKRANYVGEAVIKKMYRDFLAPKVPFPPAPPDPALPPAIICDLDGTLCLFGDANPYDRDFTKDVANRVVVDLLERFETTHTILLLSGRKEAARAQTEEWLETHGICYEHLWMRPDGDNRKDVIIKQELYERHIKGQYGIAFVVDDRTQVVDLWRSIGLICLQCASGDF